MGYLEDIRVGDLCIEGKKMSCIHWHVRVGITVVMLMATGTVHARNSEKDTAVWGISAGAAAVASGTGVGLVGVGAFEIGFGIGCLIWGDPPDTENAGLPVDLGQYLQYQFPNIEEIDPDVLFRAPELMGPMNTAIDDLDFIVALSRAARETRDRYEGARLLANDVWANDRWAEMVSLHRELIQAGGRSNQSLQELVQIYREVAPEVTEQPVSAELIRQIRDETAAGILPDVDLAAVEAWQLNDLELGFLYDMASELEDTTIDQVFAEWDPAGTNVTTLGFLMEFAGQSVARDSCFDSSVLQPGADITADGAVDAADAVWLFSRWGAGGRADLNGDQVIDAADAGAMFTMWTGDSAGAAVAVPEPMTGLLMLPLALCILACRRAS